VLSIFAGTALAAAPAFSGEIDPDFAVMLIDADSGTVLYQQHENDAIKPASTTKIMTCILALEHYPSLSDKVTIPPEGDWTNKSNDFSKLDLRNGEEITVEDLLYGMMLKSGDDAADAIAILIAGSIQGFVDMMNSKAQELDMTSTHFANAGGLDKEDPTVTVSDMAKLAIYAMKNQSFRDIVKTFSYDMEATNKQKARTVENTNELIDPESAYYYQNVTGIKTGSTPKAGGCIVSAASMNDMNLICLVYGEKPSEGTDRWKASKALYEYGFENYKTIDIASLLDKTESVQAQVENYTAEDIGKGLLEFKKPEPGTTYVTLEKATAEGLLNGTDTLEATPTFKEEPLQAPVKKDDVLGSVVYSSKATGEQIYNCDLIASREIIEAGSSGSPNGDTAVTTLPPTPPKKDPGEGSGGIWYWLIIPVALIAFLVFRLVTTRRNKRFRKRRPHYSYRIK
jgi:D-alanyl-D-alanine carboxypeptidase (penicillin-binding protein 5/6)